MTRQRLLTFLTAGIAITSGLEAQAQARFSGGLCISQGTWLQEALNQSDTISNAINTLRRDKNCSALIEAVSKSPKAKQSQVNDDETKSFVSTYRELQAIADYMKPSRLNLGMDDKSFRDIVFKVAFNKSFQAIKDINSQPELQSLTQQQRDSVQMVSTRLKHFQGKAQEFAEMTMETTRNVLAALPDSQLCMHEKPSAKAAIFGALAHTAAALASGGYINGVAETVGSLMQYARDMTYINALAPLERERFNASVSCLIESTSESYCSIQDAEDSLDFFRGRDLTEQQKQLLKTVVDNREKDPTASPLAGLVILMRDVPVMQNWMQRILFGIDPQMSLEGEMKNSYVSSYLGFVQKTTTLLADFRDKERLYLSTTQGKKNETKISQIREIFDSIINTTSNSFTGMKNQQDINFFTRTMNTERIYFYLLGFDGIPGDVIEKMQSSGMGFAVVFNAWWNASQTAGSNNFNNPDRLIAIIRERLQTLIERAQIEVNAFFAERMVVDPQLLLTEAMRGPYVTPYQAFLNLRNYYLTLADKLQKGAKEFENDSSREVVKIQLLANVPILLNSAARIDKILAVLKGIASYSTTDLDAAKKQSEEGMKVIYEIAYMLVARDSFFGMRLRTAIQADLSDTLWRKQSLTDKQHQYFMSVAPEIVARLAGFFATNPVLQRTDASAAKIVHIANLKSVESLFAKVVFNQLLDIDCKLYGGRFCEWKGKELDPSAAPGLFKYDINAVNRDLKSDADRIRDPSNISTGLWEKIFGASNSKGPTEDSSAHHLIRGKLCLQALAFDSRDAFKEVCAGSSMRSDFANTPELDNLNMYFEKELARVQQLKTGAKKIDSSRTAGVCALRTYLRRNQIYYLYREEP